jgi:hypothetical protein
MPPPIPPSVPPPPPPPPPYPRPAVPAMPQTIPPVSNQAGFEIQYSGIKLFKNVLLGLFLAIIALACGGLIHPRWLGWCIVAVGVIAIIFAFSEFRRMFSSKPALVFSREGLSDNSAHPPRMIRWDEIQKVTLWTLRINGLPSGRTLILLVPAPKGESPKHRIDLDTLKGNPKVIAQTVLDWTNALRPSRPMMLGEDSGSDRDA